MRFFTLACALLLYVRRGDACAATPAPDTPAPDTPPPDTTDPPAPDNCGGSLGLEAADESGYGDGGPVENAGDLSFSASGGGCWKNHETPNDQLDFGKVQDGSKLADCNAGNAPSGPALVHYSPDGSGGDTALLHSCSVLCSDGPPKVTVEGSKSSGVVMEACTADSFTAPILKDCTPIQFGQPVTIGSADRPTIYDIVIKATNFGPNTFAAIESITPEFEKCGEPGLGKICDAACEFKDGSACGWAKDSSNSGSTEFKVYEQATIVGNLDSGVNAKLDSNPSASHPDVADSGFLAAPQNPGDTVVSSIELSEATTEDREMHFESYEACDGNSAKVCFDTPTNCPYSTNAGISRDDRQWQKQKVLVPSGTTKIFVVGENKEGRFCATGFSHVNFSKVGEEPSCPAT